MAVADLIEEHIEEAAFLWQIRRSAVDSYDHELVDIADIDERLEAHLDGLLAAGDEGWTQCEKMLGDGPGELFVGAVLALNSGEQSRMDVVIGAAQGAPELAGEIPQAFYWITQELAKPWIGQWLRHENPTLRAIAVSALSCLDSDASAVLQQTLADEDIGLVSETMRVIADLGYSALVPAIARRRESDPAAHFWNTRARVMLGDKAAVRGLSFLAAAESPVQQASLELFLRGQPCAESVQWLKQVAKTIRKDLLVHGAGMTGDPMFVPWLISQLSEKDLAAAAADSLRMITGIDFAAEDLEEQQEVPTEGDEDREQVTLPSQEKVRAWWEGSKERFAPGNRYLAGLPVTDANLRHILLSGTQRHRRAAALELGLLRSHSPVVRTDEPAYLQLRRIGRLNGADTP